MTRKEFFLKVVASIAAIQCEPYSANYGLFEKDCVAESTVSMAHDIVTKAETFWEIHEPDALFDEDPE